MPVRDKMRSDGCETIILKTTARIYLDSSETAHWTFRRFCAGFVAGIPAVVALVVRRLSCGDTRVSLSDLTSLHGQITRVFLIHPGLYSKPLAFQRSPASIPFLFYFSWMINCPTCGLSSFSCARPRICVRSGGGNLTRGSV